MATSPLFDQDVTGRVTAVNEKGLKLDGQEGWFNFSRFAVGLVAPIKGEQVTVTLDKGGFVRAIVPADAGPTNGHAAPGIDAQGRSAPSTKDTTITRLAVLKAAAEFSASKPASSSADVLKIAAAWEAWINRPTDAGVDLDAAF